jgi:hypothetical protein
LTREFPRKLTIVFKIIVTRFCRNGEAGWDWQADARHFRKASPLASQQVFHLAGTFCLAGPEEVNVLFHGSFFPSC